MNKYTQMFIYLTDLYSEKFDPPPAAQRSMRQRFANGVTSFASGASKRIGSAFARSTRKEKVEQATTKLIQTLKKLNRIINDTDIKGDYTPDAQQETKNKIKQLLRGCTYFDTLDSEVSSTASALRTRGDTRGVPILGSAPGSTPSSPLVRTNPLGMNGSSTL